MQPPGAAPPPPRLSQSPVWPGLVDFQTRGALLIKFTCERASRRARWLITTRDTHQKSQAILRQLHPGAGQTASTCSGRLHPTRWTLGSLHERRENEAQVW